MRISVKSSVHWTLRQSYIVYVKIPVFRVTRPYLVKPRNFSDFLEKIYNFMHFERRNSPFKIYQIKFKNGEIRLTLNTLIFYLAL